MARRVVAVHPIAASGCGPVERWPFLVARRALPRSQHRRSLPPVAAISHRRGLGGGGYGRRRLAGDEPGRWRGDVGEEGRCLRRLPLRTTRLEPLDGAGTPGRCSIRHTPRGTCPTF